MHLVLPKCEIDPGKIAAVLKQHDLLISSYNLENLPSSPSSFSPDSRKANAETGFIAYAGITSDGHKFIDNAIESNSPFIVSERDPSPGAAVPFFVVKSGRSAWSALASSACDHPEKKLAMLGVTGTNGKSSTAWMTRDLLNLCGVKSVMIGTIGAWVGDDFLETKHTTPDPDYFYPLLKHAYDQGVRVCIMEVSSHAIAQGKLTPVTYDASAFTSFSRDHLDFHKDEEDYWQTKCRLFDQMTKPDGTKILCSGLSRLPVSAVGENTVIYGISGAGYSHQIENKLMIEVVKETLNGTEIKVRNTTGHLPYFGAHALENFAAALLLAGRVSGKVWDERLWPKMSQVPGRLEHVRSKAQSDLYVFVDYAHTPDALEKTLVFLRKYKTSNLRVVFGCGGDRDPGKRPQMGKIAEELADEVIVTSDNPRTEDPDIIINQILSGTSGGNNLRAICDRRLAIKAAIQESSPGDIILIAGKGHESYQIIGDQVLPFDDREVARETLENN